MANEITINSDKYTDDELNNLRRLNRDKIDARNNWKNMEELLKITKETQPKNSFGLSSTFNNIAAYIKNAQAKTELLPTYILK